MQLNLPQFTYKTKKIGELVYILDVFRKKYVVLTPEEWVRQHLLHYLVNELGYPKAAIAVEKQFKVGAKKKRFDALVYHQQKPVLLIECKSAVVAMSQPVFDQAARYNMAFGAEYMLVSNGLHHFFFKIDPENQRYIFFDGIKPYHLLFE